MPVRIYDIAKKLGLENKEVLAKAKELGISTARVPSSSLDKITAEYLENELGGKPVAVAPPAPPAEPEKIILVTAPPPPPPVPEPVVEAPPSVVLESAPVAEVEPPENGELPAAVVEPPTPVAPAPPLPPPVPTGPQVGDKVGFIQLPSKPAPRPPDKAGPAKPPVGGRPAPGAGTGRPDFNRGRGDGRGFRGGGMPGVAPRSPMQGGRAGYAGPGRAEPARPSSPAAPKIVLPDTAQIITLKPPIVVRELAEQLKRKPFQIIADLMELGVFASVNQAIDEEVAQKVCAKHGFRFEVEKRERGGSGVHATVKKVELDVEDKLEELRPRAPVVTIMGHVDHGKTTLLDVIRKTNVAAGEAGGITQHIGAYTISFPHPERKNEIQQITFLDTPGHAAFSSMRARGANVTDIVVLVVAANDGVMPQTLEALSHAQAARAEIIVAVNKCDHPNANPMKVRQQLQEKGLVCEEWGGKTLFVDVSALTKQGVDKLLESVLLQAEIMELKANPNRRAKGNVIESGLEPGGPTATVLVRKGTLHLGDTVICGEYYGKVRALINEDNKRLKEAGPSVAVKLLGLNGVPEAGLEFSAVENEKEAREEAEKRAMEARLLGQESRSKVTLENLFATMTSSAAKVLKVVVKADTQGSVEAIVEALKKIESEKVNLEVIHSAVGTITESDVSLASASDAVVLGFHTRIDNGVSDLAKREGVQIKLYAIIYELIDQVKEALAGLLDPVLKDVVLGSAEVRKIFELSKGNPVAGCMVTIGRIVRGKVRVMRRKGLIFEGVTQSLRRFQDEVNEVRAGMECGIRLDGFGDFQIGDTIECYTVERVTAKL
jgi:translation initiation factor IF-2